MAASSWYDSLMEAMAQGMSQSECVKNRGQRPGTKKNRGQSPISFPPTREPKSGSDPSRAPGSDPRPGSPQKLGPRPRLKHSGVTFLRGGDGAYVRRRRRKKLTMASRITAPRNDTRSEPMLKSLWLMVPVP